VEEGLPIEEGESVSSGWAIEADDWKDQLTDRLLREMGEAADDEK